MPPFTFCKRSTQEPIIGVNKFKKFNDVAQDTCSYRKKSEHQTFEEFRWAFINYYVQKNLEEFC